MVKKDYSDHSYTAVYDKHNLLNHKVGHAWDEQQFVISWHNIRPFPTNSHF